MEKNSTTDAAPLFSGEAWFDPIEAELRQRIRGFLEEMIEQEATAALGRGRYQRGASAGYRNGTRSRRLLGSFGPVEIVVPRARLSAADGTSREWQSAVLPRYARMTRQVEALIAAAYLAGTNTRRVKRALGALFKGAIGKDVVSRVWRKVKSDWEAWTRRDLAEEDIVRLILDGSVVRVRLDRKATNISLLVVLGVRRDGQKILLAVRNMGGESEAAWRGVLDDLVARGLRTPEFLIIDGAAALEKALGAGCQNVRVCGATFHCSGLRLSEALIEENRELCLGYGPLPGRHSPFLLAAVQDQEQQLHGGFVVGKMASRPHRPAQLGVQGLNGVRCVDDPTHLVGKDVEWDDLAPRPPPALGDCRIFAAQRAVREGVQRSQTSRGVRRPVDILQRRRHGLAVFVGDEVQAVTHQVHDAGLDSCFRKHGADRVREAFQPVDHGDQHVFHAAVPELVQ